MRKRVVKACLKVNNFDLPRVKTITPLPSIKQTSNLVCFFKGKGRVQSAFLKRMQLSIIDFFAQIIIQKKKLDFQKIYL